MGDDKKIPDAIIEPPDMWGDALPEEQYTVTPEEYVTDALEKAGAIADKKLAKYNEVYEEFGIGKKTPDETIFFFNKALLETEEEMGRGPFFNAYFGKRQKIAIEYYLERVYKISGRKNPKVESVTDNPLSKKATTAIDDEIIDKLIKLGHLKEDRVTPSKGMEEIVGALWEMGNFEIITTEMLSIFRNPRGEPYKKNTLLEYIKRQKPDSEKYKRKKEKVLKKTK